MHYLATLAGREDDSAEPGSPEFEAEVQRYADFEAAAGAAIAGGAALYPAETALIIRRQAGQALVTDGPFTEQAEVVGGFLMLDCKDLDEAIQVARKSPAAESGTIELRPAVMYSPHEVPGADWWMALLWEQPDAVIAPDTPEWDAAVAEHKAFGDKYGAAIRGGGAVRPPSTATTLRVRDGELLLTDGPFPEYAEVVDGFYLFAAPDRAAATEIASQIPCGEKGFVEVRQVVDLSAWQ
ncbi:YciI family protein [Nocardia sp. XZ_19_385]|uniref:YciI family protein n=1 Tax=Nocardia sp. XZ_19_385 TaxID=2769488 RepID=UPI00188F9C8B|nr:YciI family protein [Nocardia sp. XZ_19_385]